MADVTPNYTLEIQGLELELSQLTHNILAQRLRIAQTADEVRRINDNIDATNTAISALSEKILSLKGAK